MKDVSYTCFCLHFYTRVGPRFPFWKCQADIHQWATQVLPDVPPRLATEVGVFSFRSTFLDTELACEYRRGAAVFKSDNISTIAIVKEVLSREATHSQAQINITLDVQDSCVNTLLMQLKPKLDHHFTLAKKQSLIEALKEIQMAEEGDIAFMGPTYQGILADAERIEQEHKDAPRHLDFLRGSVLL